MIRFASCADCRKPIARDFAGPTHCCKGDCGWYHVKLVDTWACQGATVHIRPHIPEGMAMDTSGALYPVAPAPVIGAGLTPAERIWEAKVHADSGQTETGTGWPA